MAFLVKLAQTARRAGLRGLAAAAIRRLSGVAVWQMDENRLIADLFEGSTGGVMVDVGACHGTSLLAFANRGWRVYAFEPDPENRKVLSQAVRRLQNVFVSPDAVTETDGQTLPFYASPESVGISSLTAFSDGHRPIAEVGTTRLDTFLATHGIAHVNYLKVDAEGHDLFVLRSFPFESLQPEVILCEFEDRKTRPLGYSAAEMADFLVAKGYRIFVSEWAPITHYGVRHTWNRFTCYPATAINPNGWGNLIGVRLGPLAQKATTIFSSEF